jgi:predicted metal-binding protein
MKKIAILRCLKTSAACAGTGCLRAFNEKSEGFRKYEGEDIQLIGMWTCNGCGKSMLENQEGIEKKIARMADKGVDAVHISHCTAKKNDDGIPVRWPTIINICKKLNAQGVKVADGTHGSNATGEIITFD